MKIDISFVPSGDLRADAELAARAEALGYNALWAAETAHNPFLPLTVAASATERIMLGTQIAVAFPRSPMVTAQIAWDLARQSGGRFALGLGTQVKAHVQRRYSEAWTDPITRMREYIESLRAIWRTFQHGERLRYRGQHYTFRLMSPFFNPGPIAHPRIPIYLAGVNPRMCALAGEICDGLHVHPVHTAAYLRDVVMSAVASGLSAAGRKRESFSLVTPVFVVSGATEAEIAQSAAIARRRIAIYASEPAFRRVMAHHGWDYVAARLANLAREELWDDMAAQVTDDMLHEIAIVAQPQRALERIHQRYAGLADRVCVEWDGRDSAVIASIAEQVPQA